MPPPKQNADEPEDSSDRSSFGWLWWLPLAGLIYVLSVGPAIWVYQHTQNRGAKKLIESAYTPLEWTSKMPVLGKVIEAYAKWWWDFSGAN